jgi:hypothetical protein
MGYTPGDIVPRDGTVYCRNHPNITAHVSKGGRFPPPGHPAGGGVGGRCEWEYR